MSGDAANDTQSTPMGPQTRDATPAAGAPARTPDEVSDLPISIIRVGCFLHILHISITSGIDNDFFMGPRGTGSWHEWQRQHVFALLGQAWYVSTKEGPVGWGKVQRLVRDNRGVMWKKKFPRPQETRWMVGLEGCALADERWDDLRWFFQDWAGNLTKDVYRRFFMRPTALLSNPRMRVHAKFARELLDNVLAWAYNWLRGKGGYFMKDGDNPAERLPPGLRFAEIADFSRDFLERLEELRQHPEKYFPDTLDFARSHLTTAEVNFRVIW